ncbi:MAG: hypothetical protein A3F84_09555 [Candidatus Handelsmanbacteria bacterium RIFCSPLOWO2_12_FULL_64_10]|uniref:Phytanoyl-CoA dioxygenase n=1 Tax=Handelsmanbacteria sp. (strain RIFCSPLOWO2_12_FULL_64_10) TaxID=1817868 RepID=A0A1F6C552_HANXR|nr:MAG: hypothetical protein A3F84_09555 [Candidatus Handelsmanbacteria bacterium RIFCSPLOWO2_12_FULL_64_10]
MDLENLLLRLRIDGWCVVEGVIPKGDVERVRRSVLETVGRRQNPQAPRQNIGFVAGLINFDQSFAPYLADPRLIGAAERLFGPHVRISMTSAIINYPGNERGGWHADWPYNQNNAGHIPAPYPDAPMHLTTLWMLSEFMVENGGTLVVPGSHRTSDNPTGDIGLDPKAPYPSEIQATGPEGSVMVFDSRLWHATAPNRSDEPRVALAVRYAPWWLNLEVMRPGSVERARMVDEPGKTENQVPPVPKAVYDALPANVKPLYRHWVR